MNVQHTSVEAYHYIRDHGLLRESQLEVLAIVAHNPHMTKNEICRSLFHKGIKLNSNLVSSRLTQLTQKGTVRKSGKKICPISGFNIYTWEATGAMPKKEPKKTICEHCNGTGYEPQQDLF